MSQAVLNELLVIVGLVFALGGLSMLSIGVAAGALLLLEAPYLAG